MGDFKGRTTNTILSRKIKKTKNRVAQYPPFCDSSRRTSDSFETGVDTRALFFQKKWKIIVCHGNVHINRQHILLICGTKISHIFSKIWHITLDETNFSFAFYEKR